MRTPRDINNFIDSIEAKYPVQDWQYRGIKVWPIIRVEIYYYAFQIIENEPMVNSSKKASYPRKILDTFIGLSQILKLKFFQNEAQFVFSGSFTYRIFDEGKWMNRYFDPMMDYLEAKGYTSLLVEYQNYDGVSYENKSYRRDRTAYLKYIANPFIILDKIRAVFLRKPFYRLWDGFSELTSEVSLKIGRENNDLLRRDIVSKVRMVDVYASVYDLFITKSTTHLFGLCYYNAQMCGMNVAAHRKNLPSFDLQHGPIGQEHIAYTGWRNVPQDGFEVLPKIFWLWEKSSAKYLDRWIEANGFHQRIIGGNPVITDWRDKNGVDKQDIELENLVLYTTQPVGPVLPEYLLQTIHNTKDSVSWWLRIHPRQRMHSAKIMEILRNSGLDREVNVKEATELPLPKILSSTTLHITKYSGCVLEASELNVTSLLIHERGCEVFSDLIMDGICITNLSNDATSLTRSIMQYINEHSSDGTLNIDANASYRQVLEELIRGETHLNA